MDLLKAVCDRTSLDDLAFRYEPRGSEDDGPAFGVTMTRSEGRGRLSVEFTGTSQEPNRLLLVHTFPQSLQHVNELYDDITAAVLVTLGEPQLALAEVRLRSQCDTKPRLAADYLRRSVLALDENWYEAFGDGVQFCGTRLEAPASFPVERDPFSNPGRQLSIEVLREDPRALYGELVMQWPQFPLVTRGEIELDFARAREIASRPSEYIEHAHSFLQRVLASLPPTPEEGSQ
jgi:hypothetical protein